jgi:uncharacterized protein Smg (DUF494 family)
MEPSKPSPPSDEIDLTQFFRWIGAGFKRLGNSIVRGIAGLRGMLITYRLFFSMCIIVGLGAASIYLSIVRKPSYTSSMIISCEYMNLKTLQSTVAKLNLLSKEKDRRGLSEELGIDMATAKNIIKFSVENFVSENDRIEMQILKEQLTNTVTDKRDLIEKVMKKLELQNQHSYRISIRVFDPEVVKPLEAAIVNYLRSNEYVKKRIESNESILIARKAKLERESLKLDSLKTVIYENFRAMARQSRDGSNNVILSDKYLTDPMSVYDTDLRFNKEIQEINKELQVKAYFEVVDGLTTFRKPSSYNITALLVYAFFGSVAAAYILIGLWKLNHYLAALEPAA